MKAGSQGTQEEDAASCSLMAARVLRTELMFTGCISQGGSRQHGVAGKTDISTLASWEMNVREVAPMGQSHMTPYITNKRLDSQLSARWFGY